MERYMELTQYLMQRLMEKPDCFQIIVPEPECTNVCFWYVPCRFRGMAPGPERDRLLGQVLLLPFVSYPLVDSLFFVMNRLHRYLKAG